MRIQTRFFKSGFLGIVCLISITNNSFASVASEFCHQGFSEKKSSPRKGHYETQLLSFFVNAVIFPGKLIELKEISSRSEPGDSTPVTRTTGRSRFAFINMSYTKLSDDEKIALDAFRKKKKNIRSELRDLGFYKELRSFDGRQACLSYISQHPPVGSKLEELGALVKSNLPILKHEQNEQTTKQLQSKEKSLRNSGWKIFKDINLSEVMATIKAGRPNDVLFIAHATSEGVLLDKDSTPLPESYFKTLRNFIDNLVVYSCYTKQVLATYHLDIPSDGLNVFSVQPKKSFQLFMGATTPVSSLNRVNRINFQSVKKTEKKMCTLELPRSLPLEFTVFLNGTYLGGAQESFTYECELLRSENTIEIYSLAGGSKDPQVSELTVNRDFTVSLETFKSKSTGRHIVTKAQFHL